MCACVVGLPELKQSAPPAFDYSSDARQKQAVVAYGSTVLLAAASWVSYKVLLLLTGFGGPRLQGVLCSSLLAWFGASIVASQ
jgi:hypothetical protein